MGKIALKIKQPKKSTLILFFTGLFFMLLGLCFSILEVENKYLIGAPLILGILISLYVKVTYPLKEVGKLIITRESIEIQKNNTSIVNFNDVQLLQLKINGYELELKKDWTFFSRDLFPYEPGHNNTIKVTTIGNQIHKTKFFISGKNTEKILVNQFKLLAELYNFDLKIG